MAYSYDPTNIVEYGKDRMRFEIGDTLVSGGENTCALTDEEYTAVIESNQKKPWQHAKLRILEAICMKLSYQVDTKIDVLSYSLSQRAKIWHDMLSETKKSMSISYPSVNKKACGDYYFSSGMHDNPRGRNYV